MNQDICMNNQDGRLLFRDKNSTISAREQQKQNEESMQTRAGGSLVGNSTGEKDHR